MIPSKPPFKKTMIIAIATLTLMWLAIGLIMHAPPFVLLLLTVIALVVGIIGASLGWLLRRMVVGQTQRTEIPQSRFEAATPIPSEKRVEVEFELEPNDLLAFHRYQSRHTQRPMRRALLAAAALESIVSIVMVVTFGKRYLAFVTVALVLMCVTLLYCVLRPAMLEKPLHRTSQQRDVELNKRLTGRHKLSMTSEVVIDVAEVGESKMGWSTVEYVGANDQDLFIAFRSSAPCIVPRRAFATETEYRQFVDLAKAYHQTAKVRQSS